ncbi:hypothetical protein QYF61_024807 [Mycteria americana]|uniref:RNase H type-1 domain-containing protein n=1 Tax=Mycteria americana TaxID=33587 RepID=A0AAN7NBZ9_MYCAM|nr:hypothetical protein QYF61_024807 [Mycteria americana]
MTLNVDNITLKRCNSLNPATLLPVSSDDEPHDDCAKPPTGRSAGSASRELRANPFHRWIVILCECKMTHGLYAVVRNLEVLEAEPLQPSMSAQGAELTALARAAWWGCNQQVTISTDSKYTFGVCHAMGMLWKEQGFLTLAGKNMSNGTEIQMLLEAIKLPRESTVVHCPAHTKGFNKTERNNELADKAAKAAAHQPIHECTAIMTPSADDWPEINNPA